MSTDTTTTTGLSSLEKVDGGFRGWVWATEIDHPEFRPILAQFADNRILLEGSETSVLMPIRDLQIELDVVDGEQKIEVTALIEGFVSGQGLIDDTEGVTSEPPKIEQDVRAFFARITQEV